MNTDQELLDRLALQRAFRRCVTCRLPLDRPEDVNRFRHVECSAALPAEALHAIEQVRARAGRSVPPSDSPGIAIADDTATTSTRRDDDTTSTS